MAVTLDDSAFGPLSTAMARGRSPVPASLQSARPGHRRGCRGRSRIARRTSTRRSTGSSRPACPRSCRSSTGRRASPSRCAGARDSERIPGTSRYRRRRRRAQGWRSPRPGRGGVRTRTSRLRPPPARPTIGAHSHPPRSPPMPVRNMRKISPPAAGTAMQTVRTSRIGIERVPRASASYTDTTVSLLVHPPGDRASHDSLATSSRRRARPPRGSGPDAWLGHAHGAVGVGTHGIGAPSAEHRFGFLSSLPHHEAGQGDRCEGVGFRPHGAAP